MPEATSRDLRRALAVVRRLNEDDPDAEAAALDLLRDLVGGEQASVITSDHVARTMTAANSTRPERNLFHRRGFATAIAQHPGFAAYRSGRLAIGSSVALSDLASPAALRALPLYTEFYRPQGTVDQLLALASLTGRHGTAVAVNRSRRGFTRRDRELTELLAPHLAQAAARRARTSAPPDIHRLSRLTERERQVVHRLADGATDQQIARGLGISVRTVHKHVEHSYRKLGLGNRASVAAFVHRARAG
ncbi:LuxR C-terminal-related transcriptional regulator [Amycolatopsis sp. 195334CR]|uniref:response regulator transcription factor n=1 Tax=Amycolatopsis sp. 195334CR TaxID=2814588 RepID=UPI001A8CC069|nr:LuxR C-terminal-related transcriptional regulator [Amycolatopsis sp. 195334CR]MBN6042118.1 response regulator transcription factor [Amycolatopsis sp. 195334CR]